MFSDFTSFVWNYDAHETHLPRNGSVFCKQTIIESERETEMMTKGEMVDGL